MTTIINMNDNIAKSVFDIVETAKGEFIHQIPEAFHSGYIKGDGEANERTRSNFDGIARTLTYVNVGRIKLDPNYSNNVNSSFREIGNAIAESRTLLTNEAKRLTDSLIEKSGFKADPTMKAVVIGTFQAMRPEDRAVAIAKLVDQNDGGTLAILDSVSGVYSGLSDELKATIRPRAFAKADPHMFARLEDTRFNLSRVEGASIASANTYAKFSVPMHQPGVGAKETHKSMVDQSKAPTGFSA